MLDENDIVIDLVNSKGSYMTSSYTFKANPLAKKIVCSSGIHSLFKLSGDRMSGIENILNGLLARISYPITNKDIVNGAVTNNKTNISCASSFTALTADEIGRGYVKSNTVGSIIEYGSFSTHSIYNNIDTKSNYLVVIKERSGSGKSYGFAMLDENDVVIDLVMSKGNYMTSSYTFKANPLAKKIVCSSGGECIEHVVIKLTSDRVSNIENILNGLLARISNPISAGDIADANITTVKIANKAVTSDKIAAGAITGDKIAASVNIKNFFNFSNKKFMCDGDSMTTGWNTSMNNLLKFESVVSIAQGNCTLLDRTSKTSGTEFYPQWAPDAGDNWIDYKGLSDPNYTPESEGVYKSGTEAFDQATANNCAYAHLGWLIRQVNNGVYDEPDVFVLNIMGVNDTWGSSDVSDKIGTIEESLLTDWESLTRDTFINALRWYILKFRSTFKNCKLFYKTSSQQTTDNHKYFYRVHKPIIELMNYLSVPVIDSYAEVGIMRELESSNNREDNIWTSDGTHPSSTGYSMDGKFVAKKLYNFLVE